MLEVCLLACVPVSFCLDGHMPAQAAASPPLAQASRPRPPATHSDTSFSMAAQVAGMLPRMDMSLLPVLQGPHACGTSACRQCRAHMHVVRQHAGSTGVAAAALAAPPAISSSRPAGDAGVACIVILAALTPIEILAAAPHLGTYCLYSMVLATLLQGRGSRRAGQLVSTPGGRQRKSEACAAG
jgi:hypothetical protein